MEHYRDVTTAADGTITGEKSSDGKSFHAFTTAVDLQWIDWANDISEDALDDIWQCADGFVDSHEGDIGWDWSVIRDSSREARSEMLAVAHTYLPVEQVAGRLGVSVDLLERIVTENYLT